MRTITKPKLMLTSLLLSCSFLIVAEPLTFNSPQDKTIIVVRHAEKLKDAGRDPSLSEAGTLRAKALADSLAQLRLSQAIASNYQRTQLTLKPIAKANNITIQIAATTDGLQAHVAQIVELVNAADGNTIIAGHSNTVPLIITALGGPQTAPLNESDYGNLFKLTITETGEVSLEKHHFGG